MADHHSRKNRLGNPNSDPSYDVFDEDPLVELARIVSEDGGYFNIPDRRQPTVQRAVESQPEPQSRVDELGMDLETQLMEELEMSMADPSDEVYGDDFQSAGYDDEGQFDDDDSSYEDQHSYAPEDTATLARISDEPVEVAARFDDEAYPSNAGRWAEELDDEPVGSGTRDQFEAVNGVANEDISLSGSPASTLLSSEELAELHDAVARDDGEQAWEPVDLEAEFSGTFSPDDDEDHDGIGVPPVIPVGERYGPDRHGAVAQGGRSGRKLMAIAAVLSIAVLGGVVVAMMSSTSMAPSGTPPVIKADSSPLKIQPDQSDVASSEPEQAIFDVAENEREPVEEVLRDRTEKPVDRIIPLEGAQQTDVLRPVGSDAAGQGEKNMARMTDENTVSASAPKYDPIGPKTVTTWKVDADGKIIRPAPGQIEELSAADSGVTVGREEPLIVGGLPTPVEEAASTANVANEPEPVPVNVVEVKPDPVIDDVARQTNGTASPLTEIVAELPGQADGTPLPRARPEAAETIIARAQLPQQQTLVAKPANPVQGGAAPVNLLEAAQQPAAARTQASASQVSPANTGSTASTGSGYLVQLSSQRTEEQAQAAFNGLKRQFPELLGNQTPNIQRADLGDRGIYYRVRVGPMTDRAGATQFCEQLKSSGGNCFVTR